jgi:hypothetical protein
VRLRTGKSHSALPEPAAPPISRDSSLRRWPARMPRTYPTRAEPQPSSAYFAATSTCIFRASPGRDLSLSQNRCVHWGCPVISGWRCCPIYRPLPSKGVQGFAIDRWYGVVGPANLPSYVTATLNAAIVKALADPELVSRLKPDGSSAAIPKHSTRFCAESSRGMERSSSLRGSGLIDHHAERDHPSTSAAKQPVCTRPLGSAVRDGTYKTGFPKSARRHRCRSRRPQHKASHRRERMADARDRMHLTTAGPAWPRPRRHRPRAYREFTIYLRRPLILEA